MKEPSKQNFDPFSGRTSGGFNGYATMREDKVALLEKNRWDITQVYVVSDKLRPNDDGAMCANGGWFYVWEYEPNASVYFVPAGESDTFNCHDFTTHIKIGKLAFGKSEDRLALMTTISEDAMDILFRLGNLYEIEDLIWTEYEQNRTWSPGQ